MGVRCRLGIRVNETERSLNERRTKTGKSSFTRYLCRRESTLHCTLWDPFLVLAALRSETVGRKVSKARGQEIEEPGFFGGSKQA